MDSCPDGKYKGVDLCYLVMCLCFEHQSEFGSCCDSDVAHHCSDSAVVFKDKF